jgi:CubicO group peptidase (beta-lactamase class C family)
MSPEILAKTTNGFSWAGGAYHTQPFEYVSNYAPAGAMSASASDMAAYMQALLDPERMAQAGVLKAKTALALREPLFSNAPELGAMLYGFFDLSATRSRGGFGHGGSLVFQKSTMEIYPEGTVKLTEPRARCDEFWFRWASGDGACVGDLAPDSKAAFTRSAAGCSRCRFWIRDVKEVRDLIVNRQEPLRLPG